MIDRMLQIMAPHHCCVCDVTGSLLCDNCKYDIISEPFAGCLVCRSLAKSGICGACHTYYEAAWCVGERDEGLRRLIDQVKFGRAKAGVAELSELLGAVLPSLPDSTVVVPVPTTPSHIRKRGYAHVELVAKALARSRGLRYERAIHRRNNTIQFGSSRAQRLAQAEEAFAVPRPVSGEHPWLIVDDVVTTGATMQFAARELRQAGASQVFVAAIARQPLDNKASHLLEYPG